MNTGIGSQFIVQTSSNTSKNKAQLNNYQRFNNLQRNLVSLFQASVQGKCSCVEVIMKLLYVTVRLEGRIFIHFDTMVEDVDYNLNP